MKWAIECHYTFNIRILEIFDDEEYECIDELYIGFNYGVFYYTIKHSREFEQENEK